MENIEDILARYKRIREQNKPKPVIVNRALEFRLKALRPKVEKVEVTRKITLADKIVKKEKVLIDPEVVSFRATLDKSKVSIKRKQQIKIEHVTVEDPVKFVDIVKWVSGKTGYTRMELFSQRRDSELCSARHLVWQLAKKLTSLSYPQMGKLSGHKDHTTVMHAIRKTPPNLQDHIEQLMADLSKQPELEEA